MAAVSHTVAGGILVALVVGLLGAAVVTLALRQIGVPQPLDWLAGLLVFVLVFVALY